MCGSWHDENVHQTRRIGIAQEVSGLIQIKPETSCSMPIILVCLMFSSCQEPPLAAQLNSWKVIPLQPIAAHSYMAISVMGGVNPETSSHCSPLLHGNFSQGVIPENSSHCSPLQPTLTWIFQSGDNSWKSSHCSPLLHWQFQSGGNSWKVLPLQPIAAHSYMAISVRG